MKTFSHYFRSGQLPGGEGMMFKFNMAALAAYLKKQSEQGTKASYYNIDILKYQVGLLGIIFLFTLHGALNENKAIIF